MLLISTSLLNTHCKDVNFNKNLNTKDLDTIEYKKNEKKNNFINYTKDTLLTYNIYNESEEKICKDWVSKKINILSYVNKFEEITSYEWHQCYGTYSCGIKGKLVYDSIVHNYHLNAGGWIHLISDDKKERFLGTKNISDTLNFASIYFCDESWD